MRVWSWTKRVVTDTTGGVQPVAVGLERNPAAVVELGAHNPPDLPLYVLRVGMRSGFGRQEAGIPVFRRRNPAQHPILKEIYSCEVAGQRLEAANIFSLRSKVQSALKVIAPARTLPLCYFIAPRFDYSLPIYEEGSHLTCPILAGPRIKADDLAAIRGPVERYLRAGGYLGEDEEPEVDVVRPSDLRLVPPAAVIRCLGDEAIWLPTVEGTSLEGPVIGLLAHPSELEPRARRGADDDVPPSAPEVTALLRLIGNEMVRRGRLRNLWSLYARAVRPEIWARTEELTDSTSQLLACYLDDGEALELPIRHTAAGEAVTALDQGGINVFLAGDEQALGAVVASHLVASGHLAHAEDLRVEERRRAPSERLDPDQIWPGQELHPVAAAGGDDDNMEPKDQEVSNQ
jgi:hypothetical protein